MPAYTLQANSKIVIVNQSLVTRLKGKINSTTTKIHSYNLLDPVTHDIIIPGFAAFLIFSAVPATLLNKEYS